MDTDAAPFADMPADLRAELTDDVFLDGRLRLLQPARGHRAGHDALLLAASAPGDARIAVDLGAGVGTAGLALAVRVPEVALTLVELDPATAALARCNAARQAPDLAGRVGVVEADVAALGRPAGPPLPAAGAADLVLMNPPFNDPTRHRASPHERRALAHSVPDAGMEMWLKAAARLLAPAGRLALIHRPEAIEALLAGMKGRFGAVTIRPVHPRPDAPAIRLLIGAIKGRRTPPAFLPPLVLAGDDGRPSLNAERLLRDAGGL
ncbi:tRNA1(Val) (adenine(37)-N6)-methyltransferase [Ancylobacter sp. SL191]|uniref:tRNA1(Val) (adenine(37)-N6)-methyltransferase n=1 Tax=Ancylobacter sp. SL191 TaxID=2995166 RepID=UPI00226E04BE|nr:methyltransferase [Ancylobacter sp. SL191]WAC29469.1 methyltransferase [Ancylobacter sp. SL191]